MRIMSDENQAAPVEPLEAFVQGDDQTQTEATTEATTTESAPVEDAIKSDSTEAEKPKEDGFQKRMNKITKKAGEQERRADSLQKQLDEMQKTPELEEPTLEQHDYDTDAFNDAQVDYKIQEGVKKGIKANSQSNVLEKQQLEAQQLTDSFIEKVTALDSEGMDKINSIPDLPEGVVDAIKQSPESGELALYIAKNPEVADKLAAMNPAVAMMELGRISVKMSIKPEIKLSAAPDPITTLNSGGSALEISEDDMTMDQWMAKHG